MNLDAVAAILGALAAGASVATALTARREARASLAATRRAAADAKSTPKDRAQALEFAQRSLDRLESVGIPDYVTSDVVRSDVDNTLQAATDQLRRFPAESP